VELMDGRQDITAANTTSKASKALYGAARILGHLAWAWRWADWWVAKGDRYGVPENEQERLEFGRTQEVRGEKMLRLTDARNSRLVALSAALRERAYDSHGGMDKEVLEAGLRAVVKTPRLMGQLSEDEAEFVVQVRTPRA